MKISKKINRLLKYLYLYVNSLQFIWKSSKILTVGLMVAVAFQSLLPALTIYLSNQIINALNHQSYDLTVLVIFWGIVFLFSNIMTPLLTYIQGQLTDQLTYQLNIEIINKSNELQSIEYFEDNKFYDDIELLSSEASWRPVNLLVFGTSIVGSTITLLSMVILLSDFSVWIAFFLIISLVPQAIMTYRVQQQSFETLVSNTENSRKLSYYSKAVLDASDIKEIRLFNLYNFFKNKYKNTFKTIQNSVKNNRLKQFIISILFLFVTSIISIGSFLYVVDQIQNGVFEIGAVLVFSTSVIYTLQSTTRLVEDSSLLYDTLLYMEKFFNFMDIENELDISGHINFSGHFDTITFSNLSFQYPENTDLVLKNLNFSVNNGEKIAVVGENGAGKTTLVKLLLRFYPNKNGQILFDNQPVETFEIESYRNKISAIFQDYAKFNLTLKENIVISDLNNAQNLEQVEHAISLSGLDQKITLDQQLGSQFTGGTELSGGQWQKIALSRAFFANKPLLILDEPTAAIDARTENMIFNKFFELAEGKTVFFITHRLSTVQQADKVLVLKKGEIVGYDHHSILMQNNEYYADFYNMQASLYQKSL